MLEIFENLAITELASIASTCTRLRTLARKIYKCSKPVLEFGSLDKTPNMQEFVSMLRHFGDLADSITIALVQDAQEEPDQREANRVHTKLINALIEYSTASRTDSLTLHLANFRNLMYADMPEAASLFRKVKRLILIQCDNILGQYMSNSAELEALYIKTSSSSNLNAILCNQFPRLKMFVLHCKENDNELNITEVNTFLSRHKELEHLALTLTENCDFSLIADMKQLTGLSLFRIFYANNAMNMDSFRALRRISTLQSLVFCSSRGEEDEYVPELVEFLNECASADTLEKMQIVTFGEPHCRCNALKDALQRYTQLKSFYFGTGINVDVTDLTNGLQKLENLGDISFDFQFDNVVNFRNVLNLRATVFRYLSRMHELNWCFCYNFDEDEYEYLGDIHCEVDGVSFVFNENFDDESVDESDDFKTVISFYHRRHAEGSWFNYYDYDEFIDLLCHKINFNIYGLLCNFN